MLMIITSMVSYWLNLKASKLIFGEKKIFDFETPLTSLIWLTSVISIAVTFGVSYVMIGNMGEDLWWKLSVIISCGTLAAAIIPEFTKSLLLQNLSTWKKLLTQAVRQVRLLILSLVSFPVTSLLFGKVWLWLP